jgi:tetratricopeptide (TPR) repeat protein
MRTSEVLVWIACAGCLSLASAAEAERRAPLFDDLGNHHHEVTTSSETAQRYFDQGLRLAFAFNHAEAARSFREAARLDPDCAMCWWGVSLVLGPNYNAAMPPEDVAEAWGSIQKARAVAGKVSERERGYVEALAKRYAEGPPEDRKPLDVAYSKAMRDLARRYPDDLDAATLFAESLMDLHPWNLYDKDGKERPWTREIVGTLESVLKRAPEHPGAIHFYIHATEASRTPERAEKFADRLAGLMPGAGHIVHMPSHTYLRIGRYHDAFEINVRAAKADDSYVAQCRAQGLYPLAYVPHNVHFQLAAASMEGKSAEALRAADETNRKTDHGRMREQGMGALQHFSLMPLYARARFGRWEEILKWPAPSKDLLYPTGTWHYGRGLAYARTRRSDEAERELAEVKRILDGGGLEQVTIWDVNRASQLLRIAVEVLSGEIAAARGEADKAIARLREGVRLEEELAYQEPPDWYYPVRHSLGAVLLAGGRAAEAEAVYRQDLERHPENGWSLFGLAKSLEMQGKRAEAAAAGARFKKAWAHADVALTASRF